MNSQKRICKHTEIKYICLEESCLEKSDYKLQYILENNNNLKFIVDCLKCLQAIHPHFDCLIHCETIIEDAQNNQKIFLDLFEQNQMFCESLKQKLQLNIHEIKQKYLEWIEMQSKLSLQQIEQYELSLKEQKENFMKAELTSDQLKTAIEFSLFNNEQYTQDNLEIQYILELNQLEFIQYFKQIYERCFKDYEHKNAQNISPKIQGRKEYEKCNEIGCKNKEKKYFCLDQSCLLTYSILECATCQGMRHYPQDMQFHRQSFVTANDLWEQQNQKIEELEQFCDLQNKSLIKESIEFQETITNLILNNEQKLKKIRQFCINKENEFQDKLKKFKSSYKKDSQLIYKELFLQQDISLIAADILQFSQNFQKISNNFILNDKYQFYLRVLNCKKQCQMEEEHYQQDIKDLEDQWAKGICQLQAQNQDLQNENPVSQYIEKVNKQIYILTEQNKQYQVQLEKLNQEFKIVKDQSDTIYTIREIQQQLQLIEKNKNLLNYTITSQNQELQQQILEFQKEDHDNFKQNMQQIQQADINIDQNMKQQLEIMGKIVEGIQQIISSAATDKGVNQTLQKEVDQLNVKLTNCINNETTKIKDLLSNIPLTISQQQYTLLTSQFKEVVKRKFSNHSKQVKYFQLIYSGKRDSLNYNTYSSKVSGKSSLILVCRSINDGQYVFGGYYHGKWNFNGGHYSDDTKISFIFSQTHNQIYPIKQKTHAILLSPSSILSTKHTNTVQFISPYGRYYCNQRIGLIMNNYTIDILFNQKARFSRDFLTKGNTDKQYFAIFSSLIPLKK